MQPISTIVRRSATAHCVGGRIVIVSDTAAVVALIDEIDALIDELQDARARAHELRANVQKIVRTKLEGART